MPHFKELTIRAYLKIGGNHVWIRTAWNHIDYLLDRMDRKESVRANLRFRTADELSRAT
jgi:hypothetical protein